MIKIRVMFSDMPEFGLKPGTALFLAMVFERAEDVRRAYEALKEGCTVLHPLRGTAYISCFVSLVGRFGVRWG